MAKAGRPKGSNRKFYVFYDENDFVSCFGTAKQLVEDGMFKNTNAVCEKASKIRSGVLKGNVCVLINGEC